MMEIGRGTIRSIVCDDKLIVDVVPIDFVVNTLICVAWYNSTKTTNNNNNIRVYNCTSRSFNSIT